jgi:hypothetical protein
MSKDTAQQPLPPHASRRDVPVSPERTRLVERARQTRRSRLIDLSRRNNLLYFRHLKAGTLDLSSVEAERLEPLLRPVRNSHDEPSVPLARLFRDDDVRVAAARLQEIRRRAQINLEERGLDTLHLVVGFATWRPGDDGRPPHAPVLLVPVRVDAAGRDGRALTIRRTGDVVPNLVLAHALAYEFHVSLPIDELTELAEGDEAQPAFDVEAIFERIRHAARDIPEFGIAAGLAIGNFAFQKLAMVTELDALGDTLAGHNLIAALAGVTEARASLSDGRPEAHAGGLDAIPPDEEFLIADADATQQGAIRRALAGESGIISGPPGTGKSQTIVNLVAELAATGRRALFVAEKRAALDVVLDRLNRFGLGHLCLDLHGAEVKRRDVAQRVGDALTMVRHATRVDPAACHTEFAARRARLNEHARLLHRRLEPWGVTMYELQGDLLAAPPDARSDVRWRREALARLDRDAVGRVLDLLRDLASVSDLFLGTNPSPWAQALLETGEQAQQALDDARELAQVRWPALVEAAAAVSRELGVRPMRSIEDAGAIADLLGEVDGTLRVYDARLFDRSLEETAAALAPAGGMVTHGWALLTNAAYRRTLAEVRARTDAASARQLLEDVQAAAALQNRWRAARPGGAATSERRGDGWRDQA